MGSDQVNLTVHVWDYYIYHQPKSQYLKRTGLVLRRGLEPLTLWSEATRSIQLSYRSFIIGIKLARREPRASF